MEGGGTMVEGSALRAESKSSKVRLILDAAFRLFLEQGYDAVSTDLIAKTAGVSKATLYAHFASKEILFAEILTGSCADFAARIRIPETFDGDLSGTLLRFAHDFIALFQDDDGLAMYRLLVGEVHRFPKLALAFEAEGPSEVKRRLMKLLARMTEHGALKIEDLDLAADQFMALLQGQIPFDRALGLPPLPQAVVDRQIEAAIWLFLKGYGADQDEARSGCGRAISTPPVLRR